MHGINHVGSGSPVPELIKCHSVQENEEVHPDSKNAELLKAMIEVFQKSQQEKVASPLVLKSFFIYLADPKIREELKLKQLRFIREVAGLKAVLKSENKNYSYTEDQQLLLGKLEKLKEAHEASYKMLEAFRAATKQWVISLETFNLALRNEFHVINQFWQGPNKIDNTIKTINSLLNAPAIPGTDSLTESQNDILTTIYGPTESCLRKSDVLLRDMHALKNDIKAIVRLHPESPFLPEVRLEYEKLLNTTNLLSPDYSKWQEEQKLRVGHADISSAEKLALEARKVALETLVNSKIRDYLKQLEQISTLNTPNGNVPGFDQVRINLFQGHRSPERAKVQSLMRDLSLFKKQLKIDQEWHQKIDPQLYASLQLHFKEQSKICEAVTNFDAERLHYISEAFKQIDKNNNFSKLLEAQLKTIEDLFEQLTAIIQERQNLLTGKPLPLPEEKQIEQEKSEIKTETPTTSSIPWGWLFRTSS